jgi:Bacterial Ig domain
MATAIATEPESEVISMRMLRSRLAASLLVAVLVYAPLGVSATWSAHAAGTLTAVCRADLPVRPGRPLTWRATVNGGSGQYAYSWSGDDGLSGSSAVATHVYATQGWKLARVTVTDVTDGGKVTSNDCGMHVIPRSFSESPNVTPVLWVPKGVNPAPMVPQLQRIWRYIHAGFFHLYGKTFNMKPLRVITSAKTEKDICGGDCTNLKKNGVLMNQAFREAASAIGTIPYTRVMVVMAWGAGGWAGSYGWELGRGGVGDIAIAPAAGKKTPAIEPDLPESTALSLGDYDGMVNRAIAHELNHTIAWDDPHDFDLAVPPNNYEKRVTLAGPFLTHTPSDTTKPSVSFSSPRDGAKLSGTVRVSAHAFDNNRMEAVVLTVDGQFWAADTTAPFSAPFQTTLVGQGKHTLTLIGYDLAGNVARQSRNVIVNNVVPERSCGRTFPVNTFHACYYDGIGFQGKYLGTLLDHPFPLGAPNSGWGVKHAWADDELPFAQGDTVTGVWRGKLMFLKDNYKLRFFTDDGLRVRINGRLVVDEWRDQAAWYAATVALNGLTAIQIEWYQNAGGRGLQFWWQPVSA